MAKNINSRQISINHLSPIRIENNFKDIEWVSFKLNFQNNNEKCKEKFKTIENDLEVDIENVQHQIIKVRSQQQLQQVLQHNENRLVQIVKKSFLKNPGAQSLRSSVPSPTANEKRAPTLQKPRQP